MRFALFAAAGLLFLAVQAGQAPPPLLAAERVTGIVRTELRPVAGVHVFAPQTGQYAVSDSLGRFDLGALPPGTYEVRMLAVGYEAVTGKVLVQAERVIDTGDWLLVPLRPDGTGIAMAPGGSTPPDGLTGAPVTGSLLRQSVAIDSVLFAAPSHTRRTDLVFADSMLADSLLRLPPPAPLVPTFDLYLTSAERALLTLPDSARTRSGADLRQILRAMVTADSITRSSGGTGAPGYETWRRWGERLTVLETSPDLSTMKPLVRRATAYARTRAALAAGGTYAGWLASKQARTSLETARLDATSTAGWIDPDSAGFLDGLQSELDRHYVPGAPAPKPPPTPKKKRRKR